MQQMHHHGDFIVWNFGDAAEESAAIATGSKLQVTKVTKQLQRLSMKVSLVSTMIQDDAEKQKLAMPLVGPVSTIKMNDHSYLLTQAFGLKFYVNPMPQLTPASTALVPAWAVGTVNKAEKATLFEQDDKLDIAPVPVVTCDFDL